VQRVVDGQASVLLRRANSTWKDAGLADHDRSLTGAADAVADHMRDGAISPDLVLGAREARWFDPVPRDRRGRQGRGQLDRGPDDQHDVRHYQRDEEAGADPRH